MSWKLTEAKHVKELTRDIVQQFMEIPACPGDRPLRERHVQNLVNEIERGAARPFTLARARIGPSGGWHRVNGQHSLNAILQHMNGTAVSLQAYLESYQCESEQDMADLYSTFDRRWSLRNAQDCYSVYAKSSKKLEALPVRAINAAFAGAGFLSGVKSMSAEDKAVIAIENEEFVVWFCQLVSTSEAQGLLQRAPVAGAMLRCWQKSRSACREFWGHVRDGSDSSPNSASRLLQKLLLKTTIGVGAGARLKRVGGRMDQAQMIEVCIRAWNAWRRQDQITRLIIKGEIPSAL